MTVFVSPFAILSIYIVFEPEFAGRTTLFGSVILSWRFCIASSEDVFFRLSVMSNSSPAYILSTLVANDSIISFGIDTSASGSVAVPAIPFLTVTNTLTVHSFMALVPSLYETLKSTCFTPLVASLLSLRL